MKKIKKGMKCEYAKCTDDATTLVYSRKLSKVLACCDLHAGSVIKEEGPEFEHTCENCGCILPVN
jgi:hypothetical protein